MPQLQAPRPSGRKVGFADTEELDRLLEPAAGTLEIDLYDVLKSTGQSGWANEYSTKQDGEGRGDVPLYTTAPIAVSVGAAPTYTIAGGASPYVVTSSDVQVATVTQSD